MHLITGKAHAFKHVTYALLIFAYRQSEQRDCDWTEDAASSSCCLSVCMHVCACTCVCIKSENKNHRNAKLASSESCWKCFTLKDKSRCVPCDCFLGSASVSPKVRFSVCLWTGMQLFFLTEFHVLVTGGWTNPPKKSMQHTKLHSFWILLLPYWISTHPA